ncbi:YbjN domain-containing protein [Isoptericola sp. NPDC057559]|uniref:YbjN domain-containing protein n=1 Tax=Isoptericola sp. NPDC057559 TaxID=3346168 RepID=UPI00369CAA4D
MRFFGSRRASRIRPTSVGRDDELADDLRDDELHDRIEGLLADQVGSPDDVLSPLSRDRVTDWMERSGFSYFVDSDGDVGGLWHGWLFYFLVLGERAEVLQVRGQWHRDLTIDRLGEILQICNEWNAERIWPKAYVRVRDDGSVVVCAEVTVDVGSVVGEAQLDQLLQCGLSTGSMFFEHLDATFRDPLRDAA